MQVELSGIVFSVGDAVQVTDKLTKREFVLEVTEVEVSKDGSEFTKTHHYPMSLLNSNVDKLSPADSGKQATIKGNIDGKKFTRKDGSIGFMLSATAWYVKLGEAVETVDAEEVIDDDLPF